MAYQSQFIITFASVKTGLIIWLSLVAFVFNAIAADRDMPVPVKGELDLRNMKIGPNSMINLNGEWEFYWEQLLTPENYEETKDQGQGITSTVPSYWTNYTLNGERLPRMGFGTYALRIILPGDFKSTLCFDIPIFDCAYHLYLNDRLIESNGKVGTNNEEEEPWYEPSSFCFVPRSDTIQLLIQVSNFHHRRGGFWKSIMIGGPEKVLNRIDRWRMYNYSTIGILFFFIFFFLAFWIFGRREKIMLLFALTALGMMIRSANTGVYLSNTFVHTPWVWQVRMEYFGTYFAYFFGILFLHRLFPNNHMKIPVRVNSILMITAMISVLLLPVHLFSYSMLGFQPWSLIYLAHYLVVSLIGTFKRRAKDAVFFISLMLFIYTLVNDMLLSSTIGAAYNNYMSQVSFQLFVFAMAVLIIMQWGRNYNERIRLEAALRFKNKVLSVIAHDLKNPIASIAQFADLLATKPELARKQDIFQSLQESSQAAVNLLENLLYWSRSQADELAVYPRSFELRKLIDEVIDLFVHMASQKELELKVDVGQDIVVYADRLLVHTVVRNLVSNAIKFTPRKGSVIISSVVEEDQASISVSDTGIGIKPEIIEQFVRNGQMHSSTGTEKEHGTGLGLQLVRDLVSKNGGTLDIKSQLEKGSVFTFTIPREEGNQLQTKFNENS